VEIAQANFDNFNLDLMYALPRRPWQRRGRHRNGLAFAPPHLSLYHLTLEPNTLFAKSRRRCRMTMPAPTCRT
jgi:oxygen-independent coproporphyrinogen-3 oxidase